jgi:hypothetical protein
MYPPKPTPGNEAGLRDKQIMRSREGYKPIEKFEKSSTLNV